MWSRGSGRMIGWCEGEHNLNKGGIINNMDINGLIKDYKTLYKGYGKNLQALTPRYRKIYFKGVAIGALIAVILSFYIAANQSLKMYFIGIAIIVGMIILAYVVAGKISKMDKESGYDDRVMSLKKDFQNRIKEKLEEKGVISLSEPSSESIQKLILVTNIIEKKMPRFSLPLSFVWPVRDVIVPVIIGLLVSVVVNNGGEYYYFIPALILIAVMVAFIEFFVKDVIRSTVQKRYDEFIENIYEIVFTIV